MEHHFQVEIAEQFGIFEAVLINNFYFWITKNMANDINEFEGEYWTYNSTRAFSEIFPYVSERQIIYALNKLRDENILKVGRFNKKGYDRTLWYTFTDYGWSIVNKYDTHLTKLSNGNDKNVKCN